MASSFFLRFVAKEKETTKSSSIISCMVRETAGSAVSAEGGACAAQRRACTASTQGEADAHTSNFTTPANELDDSAQL